MKLTRLLIAALALLVLTPFMISSTLAGKGGKGGGKPKPPPVPAEPKIAFVEDLGYPDIYVMDADGSHRTKVYEVSSTDYCGPSWSPDGEHLTFSQGYDLWRIDIDVVAGEPVSSNAIELVSDRMVFSPRWSPIGDRILYCVPVRGGTLETVPSAGGAITVLYTAPSTTGIQSCAWNSDATKVVFIEGAAVRVLDVAAGTATTIINTVTGNLRSLTWARKTNRVAYDDGQRGAVFVLDLVTGVETRVVKGRAPCWSPDDSKLLFTSKNLSTHELVTGNVEKLAKKGVFADWLR